MRLQLFSKKDRHTLLYEASIIIIDEQLVINDFWRVPELLDILRDIEIDDEFLELIYSLDHLYMKYDFDIQHNKGKCQKYLRNKIIKEVKANLLYLCEKYNVFLYGQP